MQKNILNFLFICFIFMSCNKDNFHNNTNDEEKQSFSVVLDTTRIFAIQNEINADFSKVKLASNDENKLLIDKQLVELRTDMERFKTGNIISTFLDDTTVVFGEINNIELTGNQYSVNITRKSVENLFEELDVAMNLNGFIDQSAVTTRAFPNLDTRNNTLYPDRIVAIKDGEYKIYNSDDPTTKASWDYSMNFPLDGTYSLGTDDAEFEFGFNDGYVKAGIETVLHVNFSWFSLKYFEASANGYIDAHVPMQLSARVKTGKELTTSLYKDKFYSVFFIYCVPVVVSYGPAVELQASLEAGGNIKFGFDYNASFSCGAYYDGDWWKDAKSNSDFHFHEPSFSPLELKAEVGLVPYATIGLYGVDLGTVGVGGYVGSTLSVINEVHNNKLAMNAYWRVGGHISLGILPLGENTTFTRKFDISGPHYFYEKEWILSSYDDIDD